MSRFKKYINEKTNLKSDYGAGITFIDIDETVFRTFAKILVKDKITGVINKVRPGLFKGHEITMNLLLLILILSPNGILIEPFKHRGCRVSSFIIK